MSITVQQNESYSTVSLEGTVNIVSAAELKTKLREALDAGQALRICLGAATGIDVCTVQLLVAAVHAWKQIAVHLELVGPLKEELSSAMMEAGFEPLPVISPAMLTVQQDTCVLSEV